MLELTPTKQWVHCSQDYILFILNLCGLIECLVHLDYCKYNIFHLIVLTAAAAAAKSLQLWPTLCDPRDGSPLGSAVPEILQARTLEWVAFSFSSARKWKEKVKSLSHVQVFMTPWTAAYQAPPSMAFSRQEYWSRVPFPSPPRIGRQTLNHWSPREVLHFLF